MFAEKGIEMEKRGWNRSPLMFLIVLLVGAFPGLVWAQTDTWDAFEINAQYRGGMKKGFSALGCAVARFADLGNGKREVDMHACVRDPEKKKTYYSFRAGMVYTSASGVVKTVSESYSWFDGFEKDHQSQVKDMMLLLATIKDGSILKENSGKAIINNKPIDLRGQMKRGGRAMELDVDRKGKPPLEGKFFLDAGTGSVWNVNKFRMKRGKISISFVGFPLAQIQQKYQSKTPYSRVVFGK